MTSFNGYFPSVSCEWRSFASVHFPRKIPDNKDSNAVGVRNKSKSGGRCGCVAAAVWVFQVPACDPVNRCVSADIEGRQDENDESWHRANFQEGGLDHVNPVLTAHMLLHIGVVAL